MATLRLSHLILNDKWPGFPNPNYGTPSEGWDNTIDNFKTTSEQNTPPRYTPGTKIMGYTDNTNCPGNYTMMYLQYHDPSSVDISADFSDGMMFCCHIDGSKCMNADTSISPYYVVSRCYTGSTLTVATDQTKGMPIAVPCATITADSSVALTSGSPADLSYGDAYGWFWVGGVCPCKDVTLMQGTIGSEKGADVSTDSVLTRGAVIMCVTGGAGLLMAADETNALDNTTGVATTKDIGSLVVGWACGSTATG